jgi:hypothetical protein
MNLEAQLSGLVLLSGVVMLVVLAARRRGLGRRVKAGIAAGLLDQVLFWWDRDNPYRIRHLLDGGAVIYGRSGSGKTSSSGKLLLSSIVAHPRSAGLGLSAKPEDAEMWRDIFAKAGRLDDLIVFDAQGPWRCNFLGEVGKAGHDLPRHATNFLMTLSEVLKRGDSGEGKGAAFYESEKQRWLYNGIAALQCGGQEISAVNYHRFLTSAAGTAEQLGDKEWQEHSYHARVLDAGYDAALPPLQRADYELAWDAWVHEWPGMDREVRSNIMATIQGTLHVYNTGIVREMVSGQTNVSAADILAGRWVLCNFPPSTWGMAGLLISAGWKFLVQLAILQRQAAADSPFCVIWADEAHQFVTGSSGLSDASYIAQCRSHRGCLVYLTQSVASVYAAMRGAAGKHQADALLANFSHCVVHASDPTTAHWCASKLGRRREVFVSCTPSPPRDRNGPSLWDELMGNAGAQCSVSEHYENVLQEQAFMIGRTGGPANDYLCDAVILKSGEPFADGNNHLFTTFSQK